MNTSKAAIVIAGLFAAASAVAAVPASAESAQRLSDVAYIAAARCEGLAQGAKVDSASIKSLLDAQDNGRNTYILDKAEQVREDARHEASHAQGYAEQKVTAELSGACQAYLKS